MPFDCKPTPEPPLAELMADPIVHALMKADRVNPREIEHLTERIAQRLRPPEPTDTGT